MHRVRSMESTATTSPSSSLIVNPTNFRVIIVGGSIAGLTLAHCLSKLGVDYVVLEKRQQIAPQEGASIGILPHGGRILDQLGLFDAIERDVEPLTTAHIAYPDGFTHTNQSPNVILERFGLPLAFLERRRLLKILYWSLPDTSRVHVGKAVVSVDHIWGDSIMSVRTRDGSTFYGDLVVGADGVHSKVRREMWRLAELDIPGHITEKEKDGMTVDYACVFGISHSVPDLYPGEQVASLHNGRSFLIFPGKDGRVFWFLLKKLDRRYRYKSAPRWTSADIVTIAESFTSDHIWNGVEFGSLWERREVAGITNLEENVFSTWQWGRIVCIGDSVHKMAPNTGQGANCAIEDAAALANAIHSALEHDNHPSMAEVQSFLRSFNEARLPRVREIYRSASVVVRMHARQNLALRLVGRYYLPYSGDVPANTASKLIADGVQLSFLAPSLHSGPGWEEYSMEKRMAKKPVLCAGLAILGLVVFLFLLFRARTRFSSF